MRKVRSSQDNNFCKEVRGLRNRVKSLVNHARSDYYKDQLNQNRNNPMKFWRTVDDILGDSSSPAVTTIQDPDSGNLLSELESASRINDYFVNIGNDLDSALPMAPDPETVIIADTQLCYSPDVTVSRFLDLVDKLDTTKHSGCRLISSRLYRDAMVAFSEQFVHLYNLSIKTNIIPKD